MAKTETFTCPDCGLRFSIVPENGSFKELGFTRRWQAEIAQPTLQTAERPRDSSLLLRFVKLPLWQSVISGLFAALVLTGAIIGITQFAKWKLTVWDFALIYVGAAVFVCVGVWFVLFLIDRLTLLLNEIVEILERVFGVDINKDGMIGKQEPEPRKAEPFSVVWSDPKNRETLFHDWPIPEKQIREVGEACIRGVTLSKRELAKHTSLGPDKVLEVLSYMRRKVYAHYVDGNTTELTGRGEHFFSKLLSR